jgi:hypothetical protein
MKRKYDVAAYIWQGAVGREAVEAVVNRVIDKHFISLIL